MSENDRETYCMTLRGLNRMTAEVLYEYKTLTRESLYHLVDSMVAYFDEENPSIFQERQAFERLAAEYVSQKNSQNYCMTLRGLKYETAQSLYGFKARTGLPLYRLVDWIVAYYAENDPDMFRQRHEAVERLAAEYSADLA